MASDTKYDSRLEEGLLPVDEKRDSTISRPSKEPTKKMAGPRRVLLGVVVCGLMTLSLASVIGHRGMPCARDHHTKAQVVISEEDLNNPAKADLLHRLLHAYFPDRYQDGVYASDKEALEAVQADDADLASALLQLAKRQDNTTTSAATEASQTPSASVAATTSESVANTPTSAPATSAAEPTTSAAPAETTTSQAPAVQTTTTTTQQPQETTTPQTTTTPAQETTTTTPATSAAAPTTGTSQTEQATSAAPTTTTTTAGPPSASSEIQTTTRGVYECVRVGYVYLLSSRDYYGRDILVPHNLECAFIVCVRICNVLSTFTSTASNGDVVLVTATSVVAVAPDAEPTSTSGSGGGGGGLQNGAVPIGSVSFGVPVALAGFVAGAMLLL
ncbi:hypothetical protein GCG54_00000848 [Colletotrichum gloeosporioides]|uniref:Uncharacterized protein n=1 Tax=Colletotrichum gloeosporioides TaxID=474922 RepID=A0A8H4CIK2_COLGL|nr:uncharacterized protein GCG54_00000848 [Colletotrichum gloeosporioides]KAF3804494.1 hypothetical protein GCG54_00000848 [Colletotrichum gloeosporioides]